MKIEDHIILTANNDAELKKLIDEKLKIRYLLKGATYEQEDKLTQEMIFPGNIDTEMTLSSGVKMLAGGIIYIIVLYYFI